MKNLIKFILFLIYTIGIFFIKDYIVIYLIAVFNIMLMVILKINIQKAIKNLIKLSPFILFTAFINILFADIQFAILIGIRLILVCNLSYIFAKTISYTEFGEIIEKIMYPLKIFGVNPKEIGLVTDPIIALKRKVKLKPDEEITLNLIISVSDNYNENIDNLQYFKIQENVKREFNISRAKAEEEARYLSLSRENLNAFQNLLPYIMFQNPLKSLYIRKSSKQRVQTKRFLEVWNFRRYSNIASCN